jgi:hypothetical protein
MRGGDLHAVEPGRRGDRRALPVPRDDVLDLVALQRARLHVKARRGYRGGRDGRLPRGRHDLLTPAVEELDEQMGPVRVDRVSDPHEGGHSHIVEDPERLVREEPRRVYGGRLEHDQTGTSGGPCFVVGQEVVRR